MSDNHPLDFFESQEKTSSRVPRVIIYSIIAFFCMVNPIIWMLIDDIVWSFSNIVLGVILSIAGMTFIAILIYISILFIGLFLTEPLRLLNQKFQKNWIKGLHDLSEFYLLLFFDKIGLSGIVLLLYVLLFLILLGLGISKENTGLQELLQMAL